MEDNKGLTPQQIAYFDTLSKLRPSEKLRRDIEITKAELVKGQGKPIIGFIPNPKSETD
jgi:hypothetical protein